MKQFFGYKHTIDLSDRVSTQGQWSSECDCHSALWTFALKGNTINPHLCAETERRPVKIARHRQRLDEIGVSRGYTRITAGLRASHCLNPQLLTGRSRGTKQREDTTVFALRGFRKQRQLEHFRASRVNSALLTPTQPLKLICNCTKSSASR